MVRAVQVGLVAAVAMSLGWGAPAALADASGGTTETISVGVRSVTVSPATVACTPFLSFPNGSCTTGTITITNGTAPSHIDMIGGPAFPSDGGTPNWSLCTPVHLDATPTCSGSTTSGGTNNPGVDQFSPDFTQPGPCGSLVTAVFEPMLHCSGVTSAPFAGGEAATGTLGVVGPSASTNTSPTFSTTVTWMAVP